MRDINQLVLQELATLRLIVIQNPNEKVEAQNVGYPIISPLPGNDSNITKFEGGKDLLGKAEYSNDTTPPCGQFVSMRLEKAIQQNFTKR